MTANRFPWNRVYRISLACLIWFLTTTTMAHAGKSAMNYRLKWIFNASVAGDIFADAKGYFTDSGLDVTVKEGTPEKDAIKELELGYADMGVATADQVIRALAKGADVVVIAQLFQINPMQWIYRADKPEITTPADLRGRSIGITYGGNDETIMAALLASAGISRKEADITGVRFDFTPFYKRQVEIWPVYRNTQGVILENRLAKAGEQVRFFNPADHGVSFVANSVVTSGSMMANRPELVDTFLKALLRAWEAAMAPENEAAVLDVLKRVDVGNTDEILRQQLQATRKLIKPSAGVAIGTIDRAAWKQTEAIMLEQNLIRRPVSIETRLRQGS